MKIIQTLRDWVYPPIDQGLAVVLARHPSSHEKLVVRSVWDSLKFNFGQSASWDPNTVKLRFPESFGPIEVDLVIVESDQSRTPVKAAVTLSQIATGQLPVSVQWLSLPDPTVVFIDEFSQRRSRDLHFAVY